MKSGSWITDARIFPLTEGGFISGWLPRGFTSREEWREFVVSRGPYGAEENARVFEKWYARAPKVVFRRANARYKLTEKIVADVGCAYGSNLWFTRPGSYGVEMQDRYAAFARSVGLDVCTAAAGSGALAGLPKVEAVWCGAVVEHVDSPHNLLRELHGLLRPGGLLLLFAPVLPRLPFLRRLPRVGPNFTSHLHGDHVSAFTTETLRFTCERAGFETLEVSALYRPPLSAFDRFVFAATCMYAGRAIEGWEYPESSSRRGRP